MFTPAACRQRRKERERENERVRERAGGLLFPQLVRDSVSTFKTEAREGYMEEVSRRYLPGPLGAGGGKGNQNKRFSHGNSHLLSTF